MRFQGRRWAFNLTCLFTSVFGMALGASESYSTFLVITAFVGFGVGGNIPVDSAIFLEFIPRVRQFPFDAVFQKLTPKRRIGGFSLLVSPSSSRSASLYAVPLPLASYLCIPASRIFLKICRFHRVTTWKVEFNAVPSPITWAGDIFCTRSVQFRCLYSSCDFSSSRFAKLPNMPFARETIHTQ